MENVRTVDFLRQCDAAGFAAAGSISNREIATRALQLFEEGELCRGELRLKSSA